MMISYNKWLYHHVAIWLKWPNDRVLKIHSCGVIDFTSCIDVISTSWLCLLGTRVHTWWVHCDFNLLVTFPGNQGTHVGFLLGPLVSTSWWRLLGTRVHTLHTLLHLGITLDSESNLLNLSWDGSGCFLLCNGSWSCTWRDCICQGCTLSCAGWAGTISLCLASTCPLVSVPQQVGYSSFYVGLLLLVLLLVDHFLVGHQQVPRQSQLLQQL